MKTKQYAIVIDRIGGEFYPDPIYTDINRITDKIAYLNNYKSEHNMKPRVYIIETLSIKRIAQHNDEWLKWVAMID